MYKKLVSAVSAALLTITLVPLTSLAAERYEVLTIGDQDKWVFEMQQVLYDNGYLEFPATGYFGTDTQNAVIKFQEENSIPADGKAGPETRAAILDSAYEDIPETRLAGDGSTAEESVGDTSVQTSNTVSFKLDSPSQPEPSTVTNDITDKKENGDSGSGAQAQGNGGTAGTLNPGDKGDAISTLQQSLKDLEYYDYSNITGYYGPVTEEAVKRFQRTHGLSETGVWDQACVDLLSSGSARLIPCIPATRARIY
jgi:peptidoglycan hydrolase-like protein with peptidoglycan-binding domain